MRESTIVSNILKYINSLPEGIAEKVEGTSSASGRPDINACYKGKCMRIEVKSIEHKNRATKQQTANLQRWKKAGAICLVAYSVNDVKDVIECI